MQSESLPCTPSFRLQVRSARTAQQHGLALNLTNVEQHVRTWKKLSCEGCAVVWGRDGTDGHLRNAWNQSTRAAATSKITVWLVSPYCRSGIKPHEQALQFPNIQPSSELKIPFLSVCCLGQTKSSFCSLQAALRILN